MRSHAHSLESEKLLSGLFFGHSQGTWIRSSLRAEHLHQGSCWEGAFSPMPVT